MLNDRYYKVRKSHIVHDWKRNVAPNFGTQQNAMPMWLLDKIATEQITGRFNTDRDNICPNCFMTKSANGSCNCG